MNSTILSRGMILLLISAALLLCGCANPAKEGAGEETNVEKTTQPANTEETVLGTTTQTAKIQTTIKKTTTTTTLTPKANVDKLTLRQSWDRLVASADAPDLKFWAYSASNIDSSGKTGSYTVTGYSRSEDKTHYLQSSESTGLKYESVKKPSGITNTYDIGAIKDSPQMVEEIIKLKGGCSKGMRIEFTAYMKTAQAACMPEWSSVDGYSYLK
jgi:hypothetical protein